MTEAINEHRCWDMTILKTDPCSCALFAINVLALDSCFELNFNCPCIQLSGMPLYQDYLLIKSLLFQRLSKELDQNEDKLVALNAMVKQLDQVCHTAPTMAALTALHSRVQRVGGEGGKEIIVISLSKVDGHSNFVCMSVYLSVYLCMCLSCFFVILYHGSYGTNFEELIG